MSRLGRGLGMSRRVVEGLSALWVLTLVVVFVWRVGFPLELEWMEGGMLHQARRMQLGQSPYPPPSAEFVPFLYTPLYSGVLAVLGFVFPLGYALGRVVSILAWGATVLAVWRAVKGEGKPRAHAAAAVGLVCAGYVFTFRWLDLARPDTLFIALVVWALVLLRESPQRASRALWAGVLMALAFWTKQTAASFVIASGLGVLVVAPRRLPSYAGVIAVICGGGVLLGNALTEGWLWRYIYELHQSHAFNHERFASKTWGMFVHAWPLLMVLVLGIVSRGLGRVPRRVRGWKRASGGSVSSEASEPSEAAPGVAVWRGQVYWIVMAGAGLLVSALGYATQWAEPNAFIPGVVLGAVALAVVLPVGGGGEVAALVLVAGQLLLCLVAEPRYHPVQNHGLAGLGQSYAWNDPWRTLPRADAWRRADELRARLEGSEGEVLALNRPWWSVLAGGQGHVGSMGVTDMEAEQQQAIQRALRDAVKERRYASVWIEGEPPRWLVHDLLRHYRVEQRRHGDERVRPLSGFMSDAGMVTAYRRDQLEFVPRGERARPEGAEVIADFEGGTLGVFAAEGVAFARPQRGSPRRLPSAGPYGGDWLLCSAGRAGRLGLQGVVISEPIGLPSSGYVEMLVGYAGRSRRGLSLWLVEEGGGERTVRLEIPAVASALGVVRWEIEPGWAGSQVRVRLGDESGEGALYFDDLWVVRGEG